MADVLFADTKFVQYSCYIAIKDDRSKWDLDFHGTMNSEVCKFAQDCKSKGIPITMHAMRSSDPNNGIISVQYANTDCVLL